MKELYPDIYHTQDHLKGPELCIRAYLLSRPAGNLLLYSSPRIEPEFELIQSLGGLSAQYLSHRDEASPNCDNVNLRFTAPLVCHQGERESTEQHCRVDHVFNKRHVIDADDALEAIPIPGSSPGSSCFFWHRHNRHYLFSGVALSPINGNWTLNLTPSISNKEAWLTSLELLRTLPVDVILPSRFIGKMSFEAVSTERWQSIIDNCLCQLG